jgi:YjbE family integral membrane protein
MLEDLLGRLQSFFAYGPMGVQAAKIVWINILLSGDNAVVIALACRALPRRQRTLGILLGSSAAVLLRVVFTVALQIVLELAYVRLVGGLLLLYVAVKVIIEDTAEEEGVASADNLWGAVKTIAIADIVMSLDNVLAIAAAAKGYPWLIIFGLVLSIPLIIAGATLISQLLTRFPLLVWAGAGLLGWIAGELLTADPATRSLVEAASRRWALPPAAMPIAIEAVCALGVVAWGRFILSRRSPPGSG